MQEKEIVKIQAFLKANKARDDYRTLSKSRYLLYTSGTLNIIILIRAIANQCHSFKIVSEEFYLTW